MFRSILQLNQQLSGLLLEVPGLVSRFERRAPEGLARLMAWIDRTEEMLSSHRLIEAADIAGLAAYRDTWRQRAEPSHPKQRDTTK